MPDPHRTDLLPAPPAIPSPSLFDSTSRAAGHVAARYSHVRYLQILQHLRDIGPSCIFEIAAALSEAGFKFPVSSFDSKLQPRRVLDHQISGRFSALEKDLLIRKVGQRRTKPDTGCTAEVYEITIMGISSLPPEGIAGRFEPTSNPLQTPVEGSENAH